MITVLGDGVAFVIGLGLAKFAFKDRSVFSG